MPRSSAACSKVQAVGPARAARGLAPPSSSVARSERPAVGRAWSLHDGGGSQKPRSHLDLGSFLCRQRVSTPDGDRCATWSADASAAIAEQHGSDGDPSQQDQRERVLQDAVAPFEGLAVPISLRHSRRRPGRGPRDGAVQEAMRMPPPRRMEPLLQPAVDSILDLLNPAGFAGAAAADKNVARGMPMSASTLDMERSIARCRVFLSITADPGDLHRPDRPRAHALAPAHRRCLHPQPLLGNGPARTPHLQPHVGLGSESARSPRPARSHRIASWETCSPAPRSPSSQRGPRASTTCSSRSPC